MKTLSPLALSACLLSGACASIPPVKVAYYPPQARSFLTVTQVITCSPNGKEFTVATTPALTTVYKSEVKPELVRHFSFDDTDSHVADTNILFKMTEDGRLIALNTTTEGQAQAVFKAALDVGTSASTAAGAKTASPALAYHVVTEPEKNLPKPVCGANGLAENGKDVTIRYVREMGYSGTPYVALDKQTMDPEDPGEIGASVKGNALIHKPVLSVLIEKPDAVSDMVADGSGTTPPLSSSDPAASGKTAATSVRSESKLCPSVVSAVQHEDPHTLCLRPVDAVTFEIRTDDHLIWEQSVAVPDGNLVLAVPVPRSPWFGKLDTTLAVADSGAITQIGYNKTTGATAVLATLAAIITFGATR